MDTNQPGENRRPSSDTLVMRRDQIDAALAEYAGQVPEATPTIPAPPPEDEAA